MALDYLKVPASQKQIDERSDYIAGDGMSNFDLVRTIQEFGVTTTQRNNLTWNELMELNSEGKVLIVSWMLKGYIGHFSVVDKVTDEYIFLAEPTEGKIIKLKNIIFMRLWMDYEDVDWPVENSDIQLRWVAVVERFDK